MLDGSAQLSDLTFSKEYRGEKSYKPSAKVPALLIARYDKVPALLIARYGKVPAILIAQVLAL